MKMGGLDHPKVLDFASRLRITRVQAIGHLELLWNWCATKTPQGNIGKWPDGAIALGCDWPGDPSEFIGALVDARLLDRDQVHRLVVHDWQEHAPSWVRGNLGKAKLSFVKPTKITTEPTSEGTSDATSEGTSDGDRSPSTRARVSKPSQAKPSQATPSETERASIAPEAEMAIAIRNADYLVGVTSDHPTLCGWVRDGFTKERVLAAIAIARQAKPLPDRIPANYLDAIIRDEKNFQAARPKPANGKSRTVYRTPDEIENEIIERLIAEGKSDDQIADEEALACAPNLYERVQAIRLEMDSHGQH